MKLPTNCPIRRAEGTDVCRLCRQPAVLLDSHVLPEWGYAALYDEKHRMLVLRSGGRQRPSADYMQKGIRERLFCQGCETRLSRYEKYARDLLMTPGRLVRPGPRSAARNRADYTPFKLFQHSLLWRAHLSEHELFAAVNLGKHHAERLRTMLDSETPGTASDYPCLLAVLYFDRDPTADLMLPAAHERTAGQHTYRLIFAGYYWMFVVSSHTSRHPISAIGLQTDGTFELRAFDWKDSEGLRRYVANLMFPNRWNVERLRAGRTRRR